MKKNDKQDFFFEGEKKLEVEGVEAITKNLLTAQERLNLNLKRLGPWKHQPTASGNCW